MSEFKHSLKSYFGPWIKNSVLIGFIFLLLNIFLGVSLYMNTLSHQVQEKLGVYLYLNDLPGQEAQVYHKVLDIKKKLEAHDVKVQFVSKDDAFKFLEKKLPNLTENFNKFNIDNPLQSTLYLTFNDLESYEYIKDIVSKNKDIVDNYNDVNKGTSLHSQSNRVVAIMHMSNFVKILFYGMVILLALLVFFLLRYFLKTLTHHFHEDMYRKKIMGASKTQIMMPLLGYVLSSIFVGMLLALGITILVGVVLNYYIFAGFEINSLSYIFSEKFALAIGIEIILVILLSFGVGYRYLSRANKKLK